MMAMVRTEYRAMARTAKMVKGMASLHGAVDRTHRIGVPNMVHAMGRVTTAMVAEEGVDAVERTVTRIRMTRSYFCHQMLHLRYSPVPHQILLQHRAVRAVLRRSRQCPRHQTRMAACHSF